jgi:hypothetical protein
VSAWSEAQTAEAEWWGTCANTYAAESMQLIMADWMGLDRAGYTIKTSGTVVDIGGGPASLLLKARGYDRAGVVDPCAYPWWTRARYDTAGIEIWRSTGEQFVTYRPIDVDEIWIYDTLQHVQDPEAIVRGAVEMAATVRLFEWIGFETNDCHIHTLSEERIQEWAWDAGATVDGAVEDIEWDAQNLLGYHGVFTR